MSSTKTTTQIELHVPDFQKVKHFYGSIGFQVVRENPIGGENGYLVLQLEENFICFWPGTDAVYNHPYFKQFPKETIHGYGVEIVINVNNLDAVYKKAEQLNAVVEKIKKRPWGPKDFRITDPFGYYIRISENHLIVPIHNS